MKRKQPWLEWLSRSDAEIAEAWMEAWWVDGRSHAETDRVPPLLRQEIEQLHLGLIALATQEPMRALEVAFIVARTADHPGMVAEIASGVIQDVTRADPTLWDAVAIEAAGNTRLLHAICLIWGADVPVQLRDALRRLAQAAEARSSGATGPERGRSGDDPEAAATR